MPSGGDAADAERGRWGMTLRPVWLVLPAVLTFVFVATAVEFPLDLFSHAATGRLIDVTGRIPVEDTFTFTIAGQRVINQNWLAEWMTARLMRLGGFALVQAVAATLYAAAIALVTLVAWWRSGSPPMAGLLGAAALGAAASNMGIRPQALSLLLFAFELLVLWRLGRRWWAVPLVGVVELLWTNTHGAFPLGVVLPAVFLVGRVFAVRRGRLPRIWVDRRVRVFAGSLLVATAAAFVNPRPAETIDYVRGVSTKSADRGLGEWQRPTPRTYTGAALFLTLPLAAGLCGLYWRTTTATEWLLMLGFGRLALSSERMVVWWALLLPALAAPPLTRLLRSRRPRLAGDRPGLMPVAMLLGLVALTAMSTPWTRAFNPLLPPAKRLPSESAWPIAAVDAVERMGTDRVFAPMEWGSFVTWRLDGRVKVFVDGRVDFFPDPVWADYVAIGGALPDWQAKLSRYGVDAVLWDKRLSAALPRALAASPHWRAEYEDPRAVVYRRKP